MRKSKRWIAVATGAIVLSLLSLLLPVMFYTNASGETRFFNLFGILSWDDFGLFVFSEYQGEFLYGLPYDTMRFLATIVASVAVTAIVAALVGIHSMSKQYESVWPFVLSLLGLVGTALPSMILLILYVLSANEYMGDMSLGAYVIVTPIAMLLACFAVASRHRLSRDEARLQRMAREYIWPAGDLPVPTRAWRG